MNYLLRTSVENPADEIGCLSVSLAQWGIGQMFGVLSATTAGILGLYRDVSGSPLPSLSSEIRFKKMKQLLERL